MVLKTTLTIGLIQGVLWTVMSMLCLIFHYREEPSEVPYTYPGTFYFLFLARSTYIDDLILQPKTFAALMWCYLVLSISWSLLLSFAIFDQKHFTFKLAKTFQTCAFACSVITIFDAVLFISICIDFKSLCRSEPYYYDGYGYINEVVDMLCTKGFIPVWIISIRFGVLFIMNIYSINVLRKAANIIKVELIAAEQKERLARAAAEINTSAESPAIENNEFNNNDMYSQYNSNPYYNSPTYETDRMRSVYALDYSYQFNQQTGQFEYNLTPGFRMQRY